MKNWKEKIPGILFFCVLTGVSVAAFFLPDRDISVEERRRLAEKPKFSISSFLDKSFMEKMENYRLDQFPARDLFRMGKAEAEIRLLGKKDTGGYYETEDGIFKLEPELKEKNIVHAAEEMERLIRDNFTDSDCYYTVIPDKNYFRQEDGYPVMDYDRLADILKEQLMSAKEIELSDTLTLSDYYRTDLHWRQERIAGTANRILTAMGEKGEISEDPNQYLWVSGEFLGAYAAASALRTEPDAIYRYKSKAASKFQVYDYEKKEEVSVYAKERIGGTDDYDYYLWGARALLTITNPDCAGGKNLLVFRDSFGSSMAPLLAEAYATVTLVDLRYVSAAHALELLGEDRYEDVLFLYSTTILNHSDSLRF